MQPQINISVPIDLTSNDREEFWRDVEAATRLDNPDDSIVFISSLCRARARKEFADLFYKKEILEIDGKDFLERRFLTLLDECKQRGLIHCKISSIKMSISYAL